MLFRSQADGSVRAGTSSPSCSPSSAKFQSSEPSSACPSYARCVRLSRAALVVWVEAHELMALLSALAAHRSDSGSATIARMTSFPPTLSPETSVSARPAPVHVSYTTLPPFPPPTTTRSHRYSTLPAHTRAPRAGLNPISAQARGMSSLERKSAGVRAERQERG